MQQCYEEKFGKGERASVPSEDEALLRLRRLFQCDLLNGCIFCTSRRVDCARLRRGCMRGWFRIIERYPTVPIVIGAQRPHRETQVESTELSCSNMGKEMFWSMRRGNSVNSFGQLRNLFVRKIGRFDWTSLLVQRRADRSLRCR